MSEPGSALGGASAEGFVRVEERSPHGMVTLRGDMTSDLLRDTAAGLAGVAVPGPLRANFDGDRGLCWMAPDELLLLCPHGDAPGIAARLGDALADAHHLAADVSDARALIYLTGPATRDVLAKLTPANVSPDAFPPGAFRRSRLAQVPAAFWMRDEAGAAVICFRSVARYVFDILEMSAREGGEVGYF